jgi:hypothetical protein
VPLLRRSAARLNGEAAAGALGQRVSEQFRFRYGYAAGPGEQRSWQRSLSVLARDLVDARLRGVEVLVEYALPLTSKRVDVVLAGSHPRTRQPSYVLVELKAVGRRKVLLPAGSWARSSTPRTLRLMRCSV